MNDEVYEAIIQQCNKLSQSIDQIIIRIAGGEPLLVFEKWRKHLDKLINPNIAIDIITNLTLMPDGFIEWLKNRQAFISVSLDGLEYSKPYKNGATSSFDVIKNLEILKRHEIIPHIMTTIPNDNLSQLPQLSKYIFKNNLTWRISLDYFYNENDSENIIGIFQNILKKAIDYDYPLHKIRFNNCGINNYNSCCAGEKLFAIDTNGNIYQCQTLLGQKPLGNILHDNILKVLKPIKHKTCECPIFSSCNGDCPLYNNGKHKDVFCRIAKGFMLSLIEQSIKIKEKEYAKL
jgi:radical SAM protein with 4Fe4S-binding SPASM domain